MNRTLAEPLAWRDAEPCERQPAGTGRRWHGAFGLIPCGGTAEPSVTKEAGR